MLKKHVLYAMMAYADVLFFVPESPTEWGRMGSTELRDEWENE